MAQRNNGVNTVEMENEKIVVQTSSPSDPSRDPSGHRQPSVGSEESGLKRDIPETTPPTTPPAQDEDKFKRTIGLRQMTFMALGNSIGAGLWVATGLGIISAGMGSLLVTFAMAGLGVLLTMAALGEMAASYPVAGAFYDYALRFVSPSWGFAMGWNYTLAWLVILPFEFTILAVKLSWFAPDINMAVFVIPFYVFLLIISSMGGRWFAELENWAGVLKAVSLVMFIIIAFIMVGSGLPNDPRGALGTSLWAGPAFVNGFAGFMTSFRIAGVSYGGTEILGLAAAETKKPGQLMPWAIKTVFFRIAVLTLGSLVMLGFTISYGEAESQLTETTHGPKSPFVQAMDNANYPNLGIYFRIMIIVSVASMANISIFASSRALQAVCEKGMGPKWFAKVTKKNSVPAAALIITFIFGLLGFVVGLPNGEVLFDWLLSICGVFNYLTWASVSLSHIRFRQAMAAQGKDLSRLAWKSPFGVWGSWVAFAITGYGIISPVLSIIWPLGDRTGEKVIRDILGLITVLICWIGYFAWQKFTKQPNAVFLTPLQDIDLDTGFRTKTGEAARDAEAQH